MRKPSMGGRQHWVMLVDEATKYKKRIIFEYTTSATPQQNGVVERAFVTDMERARAVMNHAGFTMDKRQQFWCEAAQTATMLDNILVQDSTKSPSFTQCFGVDTKYAKDLRVFGEMCVVADTNNTVGRTKTDPRGKISLFVGYSTQHAGDVYRLLNCKTSRVIHSRDV